MDNTLAINIIYVMQPVPDAHTVITKLRKTIEILVVAKP